MKNATEILTSHNKFHINLGLERISKILDLLNNPQDRYKIIHIAGTNGKGSTSKIINEILYQAHYNVGLFTSPHLFSYCERIRINNEKIDEEIFNNLINEIDDLAKKNNIELSEFELLTAVGFYYFYLKKVDYVVLEVGLGGLYDATNVVKKSTSVITTIDYDHTERLGSTIDEIAIQKAGIIKENSNIIISKDNAGYKTIEKIAKEKKSKIIETPSIAISFEEKNYAIIDNQKYEFNLLGDYQAKNLALALSTINSLNLNIEKSIIQKALKNVTWRFRLEYNKEKNILIDAAHNPSGVEVLANFLNKNFKDDKKIFIFGCLKNKDYKTMLDKIYNNKDEFYFYEFNYPNALKYDELDKKYNFNKLENINNIKDLISNKNELKIFFGSIYMLGKIFNQI